MAVWLPYQMGSIVVKTNKTDVVISEIFVDMDER